MLSPILLRLLIVVAVVAAALVVGAWWQVRDGRINDPPRAGRRSRKWPASAKRVSSRDGRFAEEQLAAVGLDGPVGEVRALLLGSPTCAPCRTVRRVLAEVSEARPHFHWVSVDAGDYLDIARDHHVLRVPTLFVLDADGWILARTSGVPATRDLLKVVDRGAAGIVDSAGRVV